MEGNEELQEIFAELGRENRASANLLLGLERFVCNLYGEKQLLSVNEARRAIFWRTFQKDNKVVDLSLLPPCKSSLQKHINRANFVARIWRHASQSIIDTETPANHGWLEDLSIDWLTEPYPEDIAELLLVSESDQEIE